MVILTTKNQLYHKREVDINRIAAVVHQMYSTPNTPISELASIACLSKKQFERIFLRQSG